MDKSDVGKLEGRFVYFAGDTFGARGTVFDGNCYKFETKYEENRVLFTLILPEDVRSFHEIVAEHVKVFWREEAAIEVLKNGRLVRPIGRCFEVEVPRHYQQ